MRLINLMERKVQAILPAPMFLIKELSRINSPLHVNREEEARYSSRGCVRFFLLLIRTTEYQFKLARYL